MRRFLGSVFTYFNDKKDQKMSLLFLCSEKVSFLKEWLLKNHYDNPVSLVQGCYQPWPSVHAQHQGQADPVYCFLILFWFFEWETNQIQIILIISPAQPTQPWVHFLIMSSIWSYDYWLIRFDLSHPSPVSHEWSRRTNIPISIIVVFLRIKTY